MNFQRNGWEFTVPRSAAQAGLSVELNKSDVVGILSALPWFAEKGHRDFEVFVSGRA